MKIKKLITELEKIYTLVDDLEKEEGRAAARANRLKRIEHRK